MQNSSTKGNIMFADVSTLITKESTYVQPYELVTAKV